MYTTSNKKANVKNLKIINKKNAYSEPWGLKRMCKTGGPSVTFIIYIYSNDVLAGQCHL